MNCPLLNFGLAMMTRWPLTVDSKWLWMYLVFFFFFFGDDAQFICEFCDGERGVFMEVQKNSSVNSSAMTRMEAFHDHGGWSWLFLNSGCISFP